MPGQCQPKAVPAGSRRSIRGPHHTPAGLAGCAHAGFVQNHARKPRRPIPGGLTKALPLVQHAAIGMDEFTGLGGIRAQITDQRIITPGGQTNILAIGLFRHCQAKPRGGGAYRGMSPRGKRAIASGARVVAARKQIWSRSGFTARCNSAPLVHLPKA